MIRALAVLALVAGCGGGAQTLRLPEPTPAVDQVYVVDEVTKLTQQLDVDGSEIETRSNQHRRSERRVVEVQGALIVRIVVRYEIEETVHTDGSGNQTTEPGLLAGKAYELWRDSDALEATHADGSPITAEERAALQREFRQLGTTSAAERLVTGRTWRRDEAVAIEDGMLADLAGFPADADVREATITWLGTTAGVVTLRARFVYTADGFDTTMVSDGRFDAVTGRELGSTRQMDLRGKLSGYDLVQRIETIETIEVK